MERRIKINLKARNKLDAIHELLEMIKSEGVDLNYQKVLHSIETREEIEDTSYGHGFAFPHARTDAVKELFIVIGLSKSGLEEKTPDSIPVHVICLLLTPAHIADSARNPSRR